MIPTRIRWMATSVHEASHTLISLRTGIAFVKVQLHSPASGGVYSDNWPAQTEAADWGTSLAGGYVGEVRWLSVASGVTGADLEKLIGEAYDGAVWDRELMRRARSASGWSFDRMRTRAAGLLVQDWPAVMRVAEALYRARTLTQDRAKKVARV